MNFRNSSRNCFFSLTNSQKFSAGHSRLEKKVTQIQHCQNHLQLDSHRYNYRWLREHCRCPTCYDYKTNQKTLHQFNKHVKPFTTQLRDENLEVTWDDGHLSMFSLDWLDKSLTSNLTVGESKVKEYLWDRDTISAANIPHVNFERFMKDEEAVKLLMHSVLKYGYGIVQQAPVTHQATIEAAEKIGPIRDSLYGKAWVVSTYNEHVHVDVAYGSGVLVPHTDNVYYYEPSKLMLFHCLFHDGSGGETLLVDGFKVAQTLRENNYDAYGILTSNPLSYDFVYQSGERIRATGPIINLSFSNKVEYVKYHPLYSSVRRVPFEDIPKFYDAVDAFSHEVNDPNNQYCLKLKPGTILFVNNWRILHGRNSFTGHRKLCGCYLSFDDWSKKARLFDLE